MRPGIVGRAASRGWVAAGRCMVGVGPVPTRLGWLLPALVLSLASPSCWATALLLEVKGEGPEASAIGLRDIQTENVAGTDRTAEVRATGYWRLTPLQVRRVDSGKPYIKKAEFIVPAKNPLSKALEETESAQIVKGASADLGRLKTWIDAGSANPPAAALNQAALEVVARTAVGQHQLYQIRDQTPQASWLFQRARAVPAKPQAVQNLSWHCYGYTLDGVELTDSIPTTVWEVLLETPPLPLNMRTDALPGDFKLELRFNLGGEAPEVETFLPTAVTATRSRPAVTNDYSGQLGAGDSAPRVFTFRLAGATTEDASRVANANADLPTKLKSGNVTLSDVLMLPGFVANMLSEITNARVSFGVLNWRGKNQEMYGLTIPLAEINGKGRPNLVDFGATIAYADGVFGGGTIGFGKGLLQITLGAYHRDGRPIEYATGYHVDIGRALLGDYDKAKEPLSVILEADGVVPCFDRLRSLDGKVWTFSTDRNKMALAKDDPQQGQTPGQVRCSLNGGEPVLLETAAAGPPTTPSPAAPPSTATIVGKGVDKLTAKKDESIAIQLWVVSNGQVVSDGGLMACVLGGAQLTAQPKNDGFEVSHPGTEVPAKIAVIATDKDGKVIAQRVLDIEVTK
ncbi:MAG: hypothetical protein IT204_16095 [Fimbriimonadaceae bacterium]|nr:hypothetical protein [Fimbriimonadaceae bacterium]